MYRSVDYYLFRRQQKVTDQRSNWRAFSAALRIKVYTTICAETDPDEHLTFLFIIVAVKMPRKRLITPKAFKNAGLTAAEAVLARAKPDLPRLWNAKRRIKSGRILAMKGELATKDRELSVVQSDNRSQAWKQLVSEDVVKFIEDAKLPLSERRKCVANPNAYFAYPNNVPNALRKQVYLYETLPYIRLLYR